MQHTACHTPKDVHSKSSKETLHLRSPPHRNGTFGVCQRLTNNHTPPPIGSAECDISVGQWKVCIYRKLLSIAKFLNCSIIKITIKQLTAQRIAHPLPSSIAPYICLVLCMSILFVFILYVYIILRKSQIQLMLTN